MTLVFILPSPIPCRNSYRPLQGLEKLETSEAANTPMNLETYQM